MCFSASYCWVEVSLLKFVIPYSHVGGTVINVYMYVIKSQLPVRKLLILKSRHPGQLLRVVGTFKMPTYLPV